MNARLAQLFSRYIGIALMAVAALITGTTEVEPDTAATIGDFAGAIGAAIAGVVALAFDLVIHRFANGGVMRQAADRGKIAPVNVK